MSEPLTVTVTLEPRHVKQVARVTYESVRALRASFGDIAHPVWNLAPSERQHDTEVIIRRIAMGSIRNGSDIHQQWRDEMHRIGARYGATADPQQAIHPEICDWSELPPEAQCRYHLMFAVASNLLANIALVVVAERLRSQRNKS